MDNLEKKIVFIFGCQRSGTSITSALLSRLKNVKSYPETNNPLTDLDTSEPHHTIRLNPLEDVKRKIDSNQEKYVVAKPLVESQHARKILDYFPDSKAIWLYRDYQDVVSSMINKWGEENGIPHLKPIIAANQTNWRSELLPPEVQSKILSIYKNGINGADAWGLFWYARNSLLFSQELQKDRRVVILKYQDLVSSSEYIVKAFDELMIGDIDIRSVWDYKTSSIGKGKNVNFSTNVKVSLNSMMDKLNSYSLKI